MSVYTQYTYTLTLTQRRGRVKTATKRRVNVSLSPETCRAIKDSNLNISRLCDDHILRVLVSKEPNKYFLSAREEIKNHEREIMMIKSRASELLGKSYEEYLAEYSRGYEEREVLDLAESRGRKASRQQFIDNILTKFKDRVITEGALEGMLSGPGYKADLKANDLTIPEIIRNLKDRGALA